MNEETNVKLLTEGERISNIDQSGTLSLGSQAYLLPFYLRMCLGTGGREREKGEERTVIQELNIDKEQMPSERKCELEEIFHEGLPCIPSDK